MAVVGDEKHLMRAGLGQRWRKPPASDRSPARVTPSPVLVSKHILSTRKPLLILGRQNRHRQRKRI